MTIPITFHKSDVLVSIIIPNYNHSRFLKQRIASILNQTFQNFELIILDDFSTDDSFGIIKNYNSHPKVSHIERNKSNSGSPFIQWQKGISLAKGKYIWIAESDDFAANNFLEKTTAILEALPDVVLVYTQSYIVDENSTVLRDNYSWTDDLNKDQWRKDFVLSGQSEAANYFVKKNIIPNASAVLIRKSALHKNIIWPTKMKMLGDWFLWVQIMATGKVAYVADCLNYFRTTTQSSRTHNSFTKKNVRLTEELFVLYKNFEVNHIPLNVVTVQYGILKKKILNLHKSHYRYFGIFSFFLSEINLKFQNLLKK